LGKIKLIYIDPPYNTGNDFIYKDDFAVTSADYLERSNQRAEDGARLNANPESSGRFHSDWLSMMYPRLKLARNLLSNDGFVFISIDDHELHTLRAVCTEIFGADNFVGIITRATGTPTGGGFEGLTNMVDYILVFRRSSAAVLNGLEFAEADAAIYNEVDDQGRFLTRSLRQTGGEDRREDRPTMYYGVEAPDGTIVYPLGPTGYESRWICGRDRFDEMVREGLVAWKQVQRDGGTHWHPFQKFYLAGREKRPSNLWTDIEGNKKATRELRDLFDDEKVFDSPKPTALLDQIIQIASDNNSIILDFFAGSGTTAEATMRLNRGDGGTRSFIVVQAAEDIAEGSAASRHGYFHISQITRERIRRAAASINSKASPEDVDLRTGQDFGFRSLHVDTTNMTDVVREPDATDQLALAELEPSVKDDRTGEDLLFQVLLDWGLELTMPIVKETVDGHEIFDVEEGTLIACFDKLLTQQVVHSIAARKPIRAVFRDDGFDSDSQRINVEQIFREVSPSTEVKAI